MGSKPLSEQQFYHRKYKTRRVDLDKLDDLMSVVLNASTSKFATVVACITLIVFCAYLWARKRIIDEEFLISKQEYEQDRVDTNDSDISGDNLD